MTSKQEYVLKNSHRTRASVLGLALGMADNCVRALVRNLEDKGIEFQKDFEGRTIFYTLVTPFEKAKAILDFLVEDKNKKQGIKKPMLMQHSAGFESWAIIDSGRMKDYIGYGQRMRGEPNTDEAAADAYRIRREMGLDRLTGL
jgi:hypothetical protein